ncbi:MAG TPA: MEDS domain-containing protein [Nocardioides sp.]|nr:MEDS domain-containing protein [Nocardioides sp.]
MTTTLAEGYVHEVGFYESDAAFADLVMPFAHEGIDTGEPVVFAYDDHKTNLLRHWLPDSPAITYITDTGPYATPAKALGAWRALVQGRLAAGATRVRIAGNVPHPGYGVPYAGWDRYEAAVDHALGDLPVWAPCLYDARIAPSNVLERATALHHRVRHRDGTSRTGDGYQQPSRLADFLSAPPDPLEQTLPTLEITEPAPRQSRDAIRGLVSSRLSSETAEALVLATSETVTNALLHGAAPVTLRAWVGDRRVVVQIHDGGAGPIDPLVGLLPPGLGEGSGRGQWIAHHLDLDVALSVADDGFTVRLRADLD